jgi:hypothetical protein
MAVQKGAKRSIAVEARADGGWASQRQGTQPAPSVHRSQHEAIDAARAQARHERTDLIVKGDDGRIRYRDTFSKG